MSVCSDDFPHADLAPILSVPHSKDPCSAVFLECADSGLWFRDGAPCLPPIFAPAQYRPLSVFLYAEAYSRPRPSGLLRQDILRSTDRVVDCPPRPAAALF